MKFLLRVLGALLLTVIVLVGGLGLYVKTLDANQFRDEISRLAQQQGLQLDIQGDLALSLWPELRIEASDIELSSPAVSGQVGSLGLAVRIMPLLQRRLEVSAALLADADFQLHQAEAATPSPGDDATNELLQLPDLQLDRLLFTQVRTTLPTEPALIIELDELEIAGFNTLGRATGFHALVQLHGAPVALGPISVAGDFGLDSSVLQLQVTGATTQLLLENTSLPLQLAMDMNLGLEQPDLAVSALTLSLAGMEISAQLAGNINSMVFEGQLSSNDFNAQNLLTAVGGAGLPAGALQRVQLDGRFAFDEAGLVLAPLTIVFDESTLEGSVQLQPGDTAQLQITAALDRLNLDNYLPSSDANPAVAPEAAAGLRRLPPHQMNASLAVAELYAAGFQFGDTRLALVSDASAIRLQQFNSGFAKGQLTLNGQLGLGDNPAHRLELQARDLAMGDILNSLTGNSLLTGRFGATYAGTSSGSNFDTILAQLTGSGRITANELILQGVDIEGQVCDVSDRIQRQSLVSQYGTMRSDTPLQDINAQLATAEGVARLNNLVLAIGNIQANGQGQLNLLNKQLRLTLQARLAGEKTSETGCTVNRYLRDRALPLQCSGTLGSADFGCGFDNRFLQDALEAVLADQLRNRLLPQSGEGEKPPAQQLLEGILQRAFP